MRPEWDFVVNPPSANRRLKSAARGKARSVRHRAAPHGSRDFARYRPSNFPAVLLNYRIGDVPSQSAN
jgi:hypothetical protein